MNCFHNMPSTCKCIQNHSVFLGLHIHLNAGSLFKNAKLTNPIASNRKFVKTQHIHYTKNSLCKKVNCQSSPDLVDYRSEKFGPLLRTCSNKQTSI